MSPTRYKQNAAIADVHRSKKVSSCFEMEIKVIKRKSKNAIDYRPKFKQYHKSLSHC